MNTPSAININPGTLPLAHGEPKTPTGLENQLEPSHDILLLHLYQHLLLFRFLSHKLERFFLHYSLVILLLILIIFLMMTFLLFFARVNVLARLILFLSLYLIHTCLPAYMLLLLLWTHIFFSSLCQKPSLSQIGRMPWKKKCDSRTKWNPRSYSSNRKEGIRCQWVYIVKLNPDGSSAHFNTCLLAKGYSQMYDMDYSRQLQSWHLCEFLSL